MRRKLTLSVSDGVYQWLYQRVGPGNISHYIEDLVRPRVIDQKELEAAYLEMAADEEAEREALEWVEALAGETLERGAGKSTGSTSGPVAAVRSASAVQP